MSFGYFRLKPKPEHIRAVLETLAEEDLIAPQQIAQISGLTLTQVKCVLNDLETKAKIRVVRADDTPRVRVGLANKLPTSSKDANRCQSI